MATQGDVGHFNRNDLGGEDGCCQVRFVQRACTHYLRHVWRQKMLLLVVGCIIYATTYIAVVTVRVGFTLPKGRQLGAESHMPLRNSLHDIDWNAAGYSVPTGNQQFARFQGLEHRPVVKFNFREDLRLHFRDLAPVNASNPFYDNKDRYLCTQPGPQTPRYDRIQDIWCLPRPTYFQRLKNPCFRLSTTDRITFKHPSGIGCLPYFHVLGLDKCGTTDFHARLLEHPHILPNAGVLGKELYYWCWMRFGIFMLKTLQHRIPFQWYNYQFHLASYKIEEEFYNSGQQLVTGDGTPIDFWDFRGWTLDPHNLGKSEPEVLTPHAMRHMYRYPRFFVLMRNPVDRMYSDYIFMGHGFSAEKFAMDVPVAIAMMRDCLKVNSTRRCFFSDEMYHKLPMRLHVSCYSIFLREWLSVFHRRHFFFVRTEDYQADMEGTLKEAFTFLDLDAMPRGELQAVARRGKRHETVNKKTAGPMLPETRKLLEEFYSRFNEDLAKLLGDDRFLWKDSISNSTS